MTEFDVKGEAGETSRCAERSPMSQLYRTGNYDLLDGPGATGNSRSE